MAPPHHRQRVPQQHPNQPEDAPSFGAWLRQRRRALDLTQAALAERVGCARITIRRIEADELKPSQQLAELFAEHLVVPLEQRKRWLQFARGLAPTLQAGLMDTHNISSTVSAALPVNRSAPFPSDSGHTQTRIDWGEAPDVSQFYGRTAELAQLQQWLVDDHCRLVAVLGMGGQGKTVLATLAAIQVEPRFDCVIWRSLRNAPPVEELLAQCIQVTANQEGQELPIGVDKRITLLMNYLQQQRCLLVFDNFETVLHGEQVGSYRPGYEGYGQLLQRIGESRHQSCLLLTSREKPRELITLASVTAPVRILALANLPPADCQALLQGQGLTGSHTDWLALHQHYSGNPLALKIVAETIRELFLGNIGDFLRTETILFGGITELLTQQFARLSRVEQEVMFWLAVEREPVTLDELWADLLQSVAKSTLLEALQALRQRSLVERTEIGFTLQNVVLEYVTARLIQQVDNELVTGQLLLLHRHALYKAQAKSYVQESQRTLLLLPIANRLIGQLGRAGAVDQLHRLLTALRHDSLYQPSYAGGNLLNLMVQINGALRNLDFSQLAVWQADLRNVRAEDVNFHQADLATSVFAETFAGVRAVAFSPDGEYLAAATMSSSIHIWRVRDAQPRFVCTGHTEWVNAVRFSPDGNLLASAGADNTVRLWDAHSGQCLAILQGHGKWVMAVSFSPDGAMLASGSEDKTIRLWAVGNGRCLFTLQGHNDTIQSVCFSPNGSHLISGSEDRTVRLWDVHSGHCLATLQGHTDWVNAVCFHPDGNLLASGSRDGTVRLWDVHGGECCAILYGYHNWVLAVSFSPDGRSLASASDDGTVRLWHVDSGQCLAVLQGHTSWVNTICFHPHGNILASGSLDQTVRLWDVGSRQCLATLQGRSNWVNVVCVSPCGTILASCHSDTLVHLWDMNHGRCVNTLRGHGSSVTAICFHPSGNLLASGSDDGTIRLWDVDSGQCLAIIPVRSNWAGQDNWVNALCFNYDGTLLASGSFDRTVRLWNIDNGQCLAVLQGHLDGIVSVFFSPDGRLLMSCSWDGRAWLWNVDSQQGMTLFHENLEKANAIDPNAFHVLSVSFTLDGPILFIEHPDHTIGLWEMQTMTCFAILRGHVAGVWAICFNPDHSILASSSIDGTVRLWDVHHQQCRHTLVEHTDEVKSITFDPTGRILISGSKDGTIRLWDVQTGQCTQVLCSDRPYERMNISGATGLTVAQIATLKALGAVETVF